MPLEIVPNRLGLWRDPAWQADMPGVYALIAGVSAYTHFDGGSGAPAPDAHGLEQLLSSASTAASLFQWLRRSFRRRDMPVVWCQLLLAPTPAERARLDADGLRHYADPSFANLRQAIQLWTGQVPKAAAAARASRTLFFFSGHGVQSNWNALLLPSDYLDPDFGLPQYENCISAAELSHWMERHPVAEHLALLDACRNEFSPLASKGATAHSVFPTNPPGGAPPRTAATLAAASPNTIAYQLHDRPLTVFGEAVLEAVQGQADAGDGELAFRELVDYVKPRVNVLLKEAARTTLEQTVRPRVDGDDDLVVTEIERRVSRSGRGARAAPVRAPVPRGRGAEAAAHAIAQRAEAGLIQVHDPIELGGLRGSGAEAHRRFGHEYASDVWSQDGVRLYALANGQRLDSGATLLAVSRDDASSIVHADLALHARPGGVLLVVEGGRFVQRQRLAVALPTDEHERVPVRVTLGIAATGPGRWPMVQSLAARLGPGDWNPHYAYLWDLAQQAQLSSAIEAAERADPQRLRAAMQDKMQAQTAAVAGALLLARAGRIGRAHDWPRNLMQWFPDIPDGAVLWAEALRAAQAGGTTAPHGVADPTDAMAQALAALIPRGVPFFADTLDLADRLVRHALRAELALPRRQALQTLAHAIERVFQIAMPGGDFIVLPGLPRPAWMDGGHGAVTVDEMRRVLRGPRP